MASKTKITEEQLKEDFGLFIIVIWKYLNLPPPTWVQTLIARYIADSENPNRIIQAYRGAGKSYLLYAYAVWRIWKNVDIKILVVSGTGARAHAFSNTCQALIDLVPFLQHLRPKDPRITYSKGDWTVAGARASGSPTVKSAGVTAMITGMRADLILADDIESTDNSCTVEQREKLKDRVAEFLAILKADEGEGNRSEIIYLGTPQSAESIYNDLAKNGYIRRIWPIEILPQADIDNYFGELCPHLEDFMYENQDKVGDSIDPKRFTNEDIRERRMMYGEAGYRLQFLLDTTLSDEERYPLKLKDLIVHDAPVDKFPQNITHSILGTELKDMPLRGFAKDRFYRAGYVDQNYAPFEKSILFVDVSGRGSDATGYAVLKTCMGYVYCPDAGSMAGGYDDDTLEAIARKAKEHKCHMVVTESNFGDGMFNKLLEPVVNKVFKDKSYSGYTGGCGVDEQRASGQKELRIINTLEPIMNSHKLIISTDVIYRDGKQTKADYSLFYQMTHITNDRGSLKHDDALDALAGGVQYLKEGLGRDNILEIERDRERAHQELLDRCRKRDTYGLGSKNRGVGSGLYIRSSSSGTNRKQPTLFDNM
jgi:hypothetical protein